MTTTITLCHHEGSVREDQLIPNHRKNLYRPAHSRLVVSIVHGGCVYLHD